MYSEGRSVRKKLAVGDRVNVQWHDDNPEELFQNGVVSSLRDGVLVQELLLSSEALSEFARRGYVSQEPWTAIVTSFQFDGAPNIRRRDSKSSVCRRDYVSLLPCFAM